MGRHEQIAVRERTAAAMLDMTPAEFRRLVDGGHLPPPKSIGGLPRWETSTLRRIISGEAADDGDFET
ncbi:MAG: hypothetical protein COB97_09750 [Paracoccus sp.]|nr:MAG: hypothetical protein COB97_09750 [Paracoccus sp. (in: a-proteobacteria)]